MKLERLQELKQKLILETDLSVIWSFYMDHFADHKEFTDVGEAVNNAFLEAVVPQVCLQIFRKTISITNFLIIYIAKYKFFHGPFQVEGRPGGFIYFEDAKIGEIAVSADFPESNMVKYSRFSESMRLPGYNKNDYN